jgi:predicted amidohydrolase YtcJ
LSHEEIEIGLRAADQEFLSHGITSIQDTSWSNGYRHWQAMQQFKERKLLTPRIAMHAGIDALDEFIQHGLKTGAGNESLRLGAIKLALDESTGSDNPPQSDLDLLALNAHLSGFQLAFHVPNINLLRMSLQSLRFVANSTGQRCLRPRFEHCPVCPTSLLPELAHSGAIVVSQPNLLYQTGSAYLSEVTEEQLQWIFPYRSYVNSGIKLAFSSDSPLTPCDPFHAIKTAVTRNVGSGATLSKHEEVSLAQALDMYTRAGAYCSSEETLKGSLAPGQLADLVVLDCDGDEHLEEDLFNANVLMTLVDGKVVWAR